VAARSKALVVEHPTGWLRLRRDHEPVFSARYSNMNRRMRIPVTTSDTRIEPAQPRRSEKKTNMPDRSTPVARRATRFHQREALMFGPKDA